MFDWWKKRKRASRPPRRLPRRVLAPVEEIVEQGMLVADVAVRMTVKNAIIMNALKKHVDYRESQIIEMVRAATEDLAGERERDAKHIARMRGEIRDTGRSSWSESDYGNDDNRTLRHRQEVYEGVARELRERAEDETYLRETAERARNLAWGEIGDSIGERATHPYYSGGHDAAYREAREGRIQQLIEKDLTALIEQQAAPAGKPRRSKRKKEQ
ncbi:asparagine synthase [Leucobacter allii]|uniref:Asparagine synthase n=1 Tax=Leucobacter allii TaxID=2932247 RepID=A0ABY4FID1_9MICO|nr:asparagine synthase [Leucobacter allii]UOQ55846.1 asparagine synthase [Leucobacter allii]UOR00358.1 asparagine synthase [Leucobacter allii]